MTASGCGHPPRILNIFPTPCVALPGQMGQEVAVV